MSLKFLDKREILKNIKLMHNIQTDDYNDKLNFLINLIVDEIAIYINHKNIEKLPKKLELIASDICIKYLKVNNLGIENIDISDAKSIKRGDTTIEFNTSNILTTMRSVGYIEQELRLLNYFRKVQMS